MMIHQNCGGEIIIELTQKLRIMAYAKVGTKESLVPTDIFIQNNRKAYPLNLTDFHCLKCKKPIVINEILTNCTHCGKLFLISDLKIDDISSSVFCKSCCNLLEISKTTEVSPSFKKLIFS